LDHPNELKFNRPSRPDPRLAEAEFNASWTDVLTGDALEQHLKPLIPSQAILEKLKGSTITSSNVVRMTGRS
jgi:hypothetical protein